MGAPLLATRGGAGVGSDVCAVFFGVGFDVNGLGCEGKEERWCSRRSGDCGLDRHRVEYGREEDGKNKEMFHMHGAIGSLTEYAGEVKRCWVV